MSACSYKQPSSTLSAFCCAWRSYRSTDEDSPLRSMCSFAVAGPSCHFVASFWRLNYTLEHIIHTSTLVTVFTVRVGEHNFIVLTHLLTYIRGPCAAWTPPSGKNYCTRSEYFTTSNCVFNFNFLAPVVSKIGVNFRGHGGMFPQ